MAVVAVLSVVGGLLSGVSPAQAALSLPVGPTIPAGTFGEGFPAYYTDAAGTSLAPCVDATVNCPALNDPAGSLDPPNGEAFYYTAFATIPTVTAGVATTVDVEFDVEAAFVGPTPADGITFDRLRVRGGVPAGTYSLEHPYGQTTLNSDGDPVTGINVTNDVGCAPPCNFDLATGGPITNFLRSTTAPVGFFGDSATATTVTGATATDGPAATPRNLLRLRNSTGAVVGQTDQFIITGQLADGAATLLSDTAIEFGNVATATRTLNVTNIGNAALNLGAPAVPAGPFTVTSNTCSAAPIAPQDSCAVGLTYASTVANLNANATLTMSTNTPAAKPVSVALHATSLPAAGVTGSPVAFGPNKVGTPSTKTVTLTNTGVAPLAVGTATATGPFTASQTCGASLPVGATCTVSATYTATVLGAQSGTLTIAHPGASGGSTLVPLTGSGTVPNAALSDAVLEFGNVRPGTVSAVKTERLTNTGDAVLVLGAAAPVSVTGPFVVESSDCPATLAPAAFCRVAVTFRPTAIGSAPGTLTLPNDASPPVPGGAAQVALHGTGAALAPAAPTRVAAARGNGSAQVSWLAPDNGGQAITAYDVFAIASGGTVTTQRVAGGATSLSFAGLTNGRTYRFQVRAVNGVGAGPRSAISAAAVPSTRPSAPRIGTSTSGRRGGKATAKVAWRAPVSNGGSAVTRYRVSIRRVGKTAVRTLNVSSQARSRTVSKLVRNARYRFFVTAVNARGTSRRSALSRMVVAR